MTQVCIALMLLISSVMSFETWYPCKLKEYPEGHNCVCSEDYCDTLDVPTPSHGSRLVLITSSKSGDRFSYTKWKFVNGTDDKCESQSTTLKVNRRKSFRESRIFGFGGGFTGTVSYILTRLPPQLQECFYNSYYSLDDGLSYTLMRIPIGSSDFDLENWAYNLTPENDRKLSNFTRLDDRDRQRNHQIKEMKSVTGLKNVQIFGCPWTPPPWMKAKNQWTGLADNQLKPKYYQIWANYLARWARFMIRDGIPLWGISLGNEPLFAPNTNISALNWKPRDQARWYVENLEPALNRAKLTNLRIIGYDDHRGGVIEWLNEMEMEKPRVVDDIDMIGIHGYFDSETNDHILDELNQQYDAPILYTEMSFRNITYGSWQRAEEFINLLISALKRNVVGYVDWNLILDQSKTSNMANFPLDAFIIVNENYKSFEKQPMFYAMAHFSRYIPPGSIRIDTNICGAMKDSLQSLAYWRLDGKTTVILYNSSDQTVNLTINDEYKGTANITIKPRSLNTIVYSTRYKRVKTLSVKSAAAIRPKN